MISDNIFGQLFEDKFILEYTNNILTSAMSYAWNESAWVLEEESSRITISYNANGKIDVFLTEEWNGTSWMLSDKSDYTYDGNNRINIIEGQTWDDTSWVSDYKEEFTYDANGNLTTDPIQADRKTQWYEETEAIMRTTLENGLKE